MRNVRIQERYAHGRGVATYLARYMRGGPIKNHRLVAFDAKSVTFDMAIIGKLMRRVEPKRA